MSEQNSGVQKTGEGTPASQAPAGTENQNSPAGQGPASNQKPEGSEDVVTLTKEEHEALLKKATDFDGMVIKKRAEKLAKKEEPKSPDGQEINQDTKEQILAAAREEGRKAAINAANQLQFNSNLQPAFQEFVKLHPWANNDEKLEQIRKNFQPENITSVKEITAALENAAERTFPVEYQKAKEDSYKKKALAQGANISAGEGTGEGGQPSAGNQAPKKQMTSEEEKFAKAFGIS